MEETLSVNYPVLRQIKGVLLNMFKKHHARKIQNCTSIREARRDRYIESTERKVSSPSICILLGFTIITTRSIEIDYL